METIYLVRAFGTLLCVVGVFLCLRLGRKRFAKLSTTRNVAIGAAMVSAAGLWKFLAFAGLAAVPAAAAAVANYHTFVGVHEVHACAQCHVMLPMVNDLHDAQSDTLAARHYKNRWIPKDQCYACHSDYGLGGDIAAKAEGFRHLARYTTRTYHEPIQHRGAFDNQNCLKCHSGAIKYERVQSHQTAKVLLSTSAMSCTNCHGRAHPTRDQRTPGSADYARLMEAYR